MRGVRYRGSRLDILASTDTITVTVTEPGAKPVAIGFTGDWILRETGQRGSLFTIDSRAVSRFDRCPAG